MNIKDLKYFIELTHVKHFSQVAKKFNVSQPTITIATKRLEKEMGCQLVNRHHANSFILTDEGEQFLKHAEAILNHFQLAKREIKEMDQDQMVIGLPPLIENNYFMPIAKRLADAGLLDKIMTTEEGSETTLQYLNNGKVDLSLLGSIDTLDQAEIKTEKFDEQPFRIYVSTDNPLSNRKEVTFAELQKQKFVQFKRGFVHNYAFDLLCRRNGIHPEVVFRSDEMNTITNLIANNIGIGFFTPLVPINHDKIVSIPLVDKDIPIFKVSLAYRSSHYFNEWQQRVVNCIRAGIDDFKQQR